MWWRSCALIAAGLIGLAGAGLGGCGVQPLYGGSTVGGQKVAEAMKAVDVTPIPGRVGQRVRNELIFANTGGGYGAPSRYKLDIAVKESVTDQLVQITGDATSQVYQLEATFKLTRIDSGKVIYQGNAIARAPYNRFQEVFANVRARYNAEDRAAETVAESIKTQLAAYLSTAT